MRGFRNREEHFLNAKIDAERARTRKRANRDVPLRAPLAKKKTEASEANQGPIESKQVKRASRRSSVDLPLLRKRTHRLRTESVSVESKQPKSSEQAAWQPPKLTVEEQWEDFEKKVELEGVHETAQAREEEWIGGQERSYHPGRLRRKRRGLDQGQAKLSVKDYNAHRGSRHWHGRGRRGKPPKYKTEHEHRRLKNKK